MIEIGIGANKNTEQKFEQPAKISWELARSCAQQMNVQDFKEWEKISETQKKITMNGVRIFFEQDKTPEELHENWIIERKESLLHFVQYKDIQVSARILDQSVKAVTDILKKFSQETGTEI